MKSHHQRTKKMKLTKTKIDRFKYNSRARDVRWDSEISGFGLRIYPPTERGTKKAFVLSYRHEGRKRLMVLGSYGEITLDQARTIAGEKLYALKRHGIDPLEAKREAKSGKTFKDLRKKYIDYKKRKKYKTWEADEARLKRHAPKAWDNRLAKSIKAHEIDNLHKEIGGKYPYEANRLLALLRHMFKLGARDAWNYILPKEHINPCLEIEKFREKKRKRFAKPHEIKSIAKAIDAYPQIYIRAVLWLYLLTGTRKTELLSAKWADVDFDERTLTLPDTKAGEEQSVSLSPTAIALIQGIPRVKKNPYIFVGNKKGKHLVNIFKPWDAIRRAAGCDDLRLHDLRRTVGTWMTRAGVDLNTIKSALRHADIATTLIYADAGEEVAKDALDEHSKAIMKAAGKDELKLVKE